MVYVDRQGPGYVTFLLCWKAALISDKVILGM